MKFKVVGGVLTLVILILAALSVSAVAAPRAAESQQVAACPADDVAMYAESPAEWVRLCVEERPISIRD